MWAISRKPGHLIPRQCNSVKGKAGMRKGYRKFANNLFLLFSSPSSLLQEISLCLKFPEIPPLVDSFFI